MHKGFPAKLCCAYENKNGHCVLVHEMLLCGE